MPVDWLQVSTNVANGGYRYQAATSLLLRSDASRFGEFLVCASEGWRLRIQSSLPSEGHQRTNVTLSHECRSGQPIFFASSAADGWQYRFSTVRLRWEIPGAQSVYGPPAARRDEAVRTGTFGAAAMIYAARSLGLGSTLMIGFDAEAVHREFGLAKDEVPVMLLSIGAEPPGSWPQKPRRPVANVLDLV